MSQSPTLPQRPAYDDREEWRKYWKAQKKPWRTEPEINVERQKYLINRRSKKPDIEKGIYPFKDIPLTRADIEWLLATHEDDRGPIVWSDISQHFRMGLDLRGANLREEDLSSLPLARINAGFDQDGSLHTGEQIEAASIHLEGANLRSTHLEGANLSSAFFDSITTLNEITLNNSEYGAVSLADVHWDDVNVAVIDWSTLSLLGDEHKAKQQKTDDWKPKDNTMQLAGYRRAVRAYRQLSVVLRNQRINEDAARFAYRAQLMQRRVFWHQGIRKFGQYLFSLFIDLLAGYGYKPWRSFATYIVVIGIFAAIYLLLGPHLAWNEAIVISMTAFHGRGFFPTQFQPGDPQALVAAIEAFVGLLIEVTFIATLTQRLFGK